MAKSIIDTELKCYICGKRQGLEMHHIFGAFNRSRADRDGLKVYLCHECHNEPPNGVHHNRKNNLRLKQIGQKAWMEHYGKSEADFIKEYGKSYL